MLVGLAASPTSGLFTKQQVEAGAQVFQAHCAVCHGANLAGNPEVGAPPLKGPGFTSTWPSYGTVGQLYDFISTYMPASAPGSLSSKQYLEVLIYLLAQNGFPTGSTPATLQSLKHVPLQLPPKNTSNASSSVTAW